MALMSIGVLAATGFAWNTVSGLNGDITQLALGLGGSDDGAVDILLVGTDSRTDAKGEPLSESELNWLRAGGDVSTSTDTILLIRVPDDGSSATAVSIPRDSYVEVPGIGKSKINAAYGATREGVRRELVEAGTDPAEAEAEATQAGRKALVDSVADLTGVSVDHYAEVGLLGFALLTDAVGGVEVCLKEPVDEPMSGANFEAGRQTLDGPEALSFVRQRHGLPRGDLDRITRQQVYMASLAQQVLSTQTLTDPGKLDRLQQAVTRSVVIDDQWDIFGFIDQFKDLSGGKVRFSTIPVVNDHGWSEDGQQSVVEVDPEEVRSYVDTLLGGHPDSVRATYNVDVVNAGTVDGLAGNVMRMLTANGFLAGETSSRPVNQRDSVILAHSADDAGARQLAADLGGMEIREDTSIPEDRLTAILTNTYTGPGGVSDLTEPAPAGDGGGERHQPAAFSAGGDGPVCVN